MHQIEPFFHWQHLYRAEEDENSPFFGKNYSEFIFTNKVYNFALHPQWDSIGSDTLFTKLIYASTSEKFAIIECIGEWNDCITNDIKLLKEFLLDGLVERGIQTLCFIGENVLNFHGEDDCYYQELSEELGKGNLFFINFLPHVVEELNNFGILNYVQYFVMDEKEDWRKKTPHQVMDYLSIKSKKTS
ncbi:MAG: hypothetical protein VXX63_03700 [Bacteroidota bacterium]|nr:hypothetical protein [Bacteroidota bacterium]